MKVGQKPQVNMQVLQPFVTFIIYSSYGKRFVTIPSSVPVMIIGDSISNRRTTLRGVQTEISRDLPPIWPHHIQNKA